LSLTTEASQLTKLNPVKRVAEAAASTEAAAAEADSAAETAEAVSAAEKDTKLNQAGLTTRFFFARNPGLIDNVNFSIAIYFLRCIVSMSDRYFG